MKIDKYLAELPDNLWSAETSNEAGDTLRELAKDMREECQRQQPIKDKFHTEMTESERGFSAGWNAAINKWNRAIESIEIK